MNVRQFIRCSRKVGRCNVNWVLYESCCFCQYKTRLFSSIFRLPVPVAAQSKA